MKASLLLRALGEFEVYQFIEDIDEFKEFFNANQDNFNIFELAVLENIEETKINDEFTVYDMTLKQSGDHFWLIKDSLTGMYEPIDSEEQLQEVLKHLKPEE